MIKEVRLPQMGQTMEEGTIVSCMVEVGEEVGKGDCIFEIETDKATLEIESPAGGFVKHILVEEDQTLPVGEPLMVLADEDEEVSQDFLDSLKNAGSAPAATEAIPVKESAKCDGNKLPALKANGKIITSPRAKTLAKSLGIELSSISGTGPGGKITEADVEKTGADSAKDLTNSEITPKLGATLPINKMQRITGERMVKSKQEIPCFYLNIKVDLTALVELRSKLNKNSETKLSFNDFIIKAVASGLAEFPKMTAQLLGSKMKLADTINISLAVSVPDGLVTPVINDVQSKDVTQISYESKALIEKARANKLLLTELEGACITISTLGGFGIESFIPVVIPGQCSILGIGEIADNCVPINGEIAIRKLMKMTLAVDHRIVDGAYASQFLAFVKAQLEEISNFA